MDDYSDIDAKPGRSWWLFRRVFGVSEQVTNYCPLVDMR
jgi:hypothetical protein